MFVDHELGTPSRSPSLVTYTATGSLTRDYSSSVSLEMAVWRSRDPSQPRDAEHSDSGTDDFTPSEGLKTIYSGISVAFTTSVAQPTKIRQCHSGVFLLGMT